VNAVIAQAALRKRCARASSAQMAVGSASGGAVVECVRQLEAKLESLRLRVQALEGAVWTSRVNDCESSGPSETAGHELGDDATEPSMPLPALLVRPRSQGRPGGTLTEDEQLKEGRVRFSIAAATVPPEVVLDLPPGLTAPSQLLSPCGGAADVAGADGVAASSVDADVALPGTANPVVRRMPEGCHNTDVSCQSARTTVEWRIDGLRSKLRVSRGFPLTSRPFQIDGAELRLMFSPGDRWASFADARPSRESRHRKGLDAQDASVVARPLASSYGSLCLKVSFVRAGLDTLKFRVRIGNRQQTGVIECNLAEKAVHEFPLQHDWRRLLEPSGDSLFVCAELL